MDTSLHSACDFSLEKRQILLNMHAHTIYTYIFPLIYNENGRQKHTFAFSKCFGYKVLASKGKYDERQEFCGKLPIDSAGIA